MEASKVWPLVKSDATGGVPNTGVPFSTVTVLVKVLTFPKVSVDV
jgi:hypothetical protein